MHIENLLTAEIKNSFEIPLTLSLLKQHSVATFLNQISKI